MSIHPPGRRDTDNISLIGNISMRGNLLRFRNNREFFEANSMSEDKKKEKSFMGAKT